MKKRFNAVKAAVLAAAFILLLGISAAAGYYIYLGYTMYSSAIEAKSVSEMAADIKAAVGSSDMMSCPNFTQMR